MAIKTVVIEFDPKSLSDAILRLEQDRVIDLVLWLIDPRTRHLAHPSTIPMTFENLMERYNRMSLANFPQEYYQEALSYLYPFINITNRWIPSTEISDYLHLFHLLLHIWHKIFKEAQAELLLIQDAPHGPIQYMAYVMAKLMGVKVIVTEPACFTTDSFLCYSAVERIGMDYLNCDLGFEKKDIVVTMGIGKTPFYMRGKIKSTLISGRVRLMTIVKSFFSLKSCREYYKKHGPLFLYKVGEKIGYRMIELYLTSWFRMHRNDACQAVDFQKAYVYFPLHLQPEKTTDVLGGIYEDQLLALERLSRLIPSDWKIYVKENPKQSYYKRSELFFLRCSYIDNVVFVPPETDTFELTRNSQFVATINGTVGWEAITAGKKVLCFGYAWYRSLVGAIAYTENLTFDDICNYSFCQEDVSKSMEAFSKSLFPGVISDMTNAYELNPNFSIEENNEKVYRSLKMAILHYDDR